MKFNYDNETDALYINFVDIPGVDSFEISPDYIVDVDDQGNVIGIEVLNVKGKVDFTQMIFNHIPTKDISFINQPMFG
ncbi:MAG: DUF2283 domain-containing protein [bacterium]